MTDRYESPLSTRYASPYMLQLFSADTRYQTWRRLWVSLARAEMELGLPITQGQVEELEAHISEIDYDCVRRREKEVRHDVMAHVYAFGQQCPKSTPLDRRPPLPPASSIWGPPAAMSQTTPI